MAEVRDERRDERLRVLLVMPYEQYVRKAREVGLWVCSVWDPGLASPDYLRQVEDNSDAFLLADFADPDGFRDALRTAALEHDVRWIYHIGREDSMLPAFEVAEELGKTPNPARAIRILNDKQAMRALLQSARLSPVRYATAPDVGSVRPALDRVGLPAIVKPTVLSGSRGVYLVEAPDDIDRWAGLVDGYGYRGPFLVEERLVGPEFSVESLSEDGRHTIVGITAKEVTPPPLFVETAHVHPAPLPTSDRRAIEELVTRLLDLAGYRLGPAHTEIILTARGPRIVESQARLGGDQIPRLVELSCGVDVERAVFAMLAGAPAPVVVHHATARIGYVSYPPGTVRVVHGVDRARDLAGVDDLALPFGVGDVLPVTRDSKSRHGHVIVVGDSAASTAARFAAVTRLFRVETAPEAMCDESPAGRVAAGHVDLPTISVAADPPPPSIDPPCVVQKKVPHADHRH